MNVSTCRASIYSLIGFKKGEINHNTCCNVNLTDLIDMCSCWRVKKEKTTPTKNFKAMNEEKWSQLGTAAELIHDFRHSDQYILSKI